MGHRNQSRSPYPKEEHTPAAHHPKQQSQGLAAAPQHLHPRPSSTAHPQHHQPPPRPSSQQQSPYQANQSIQAPYQPQGQAPTGQHNQDLPYYSQQNSPYGTPGTTSGYPSAEPPEMMAATQMPRPYPPMTSYHTPQSNSPSSVASPAGHEQHRGMYGQQPSQLQQQSIYYGGQQAQYPAMPTQAAPSPYQQHAQQPHQAMPSQPGMMMSHGGPQQHGLPQQQTTHHAQSGMTGSPRNTKLEPQVSPQMPRSVAGPLAASQHHQQNGSGALVTPTSTTTSAVNNSNNNNAAPGPIPATTPLVVRSDNNGVMWIAFEYSRDRVKMEYTIRCDVESVNTDELSQEFKNENCVYPRACNGKEGYRGNRLQYETECNSVGWSLAELNPCLRGKRGLIQRAVDSWRNSNQDPRLRSRRVRRMAKMNVRSKPGPTSHAGHLAGPGSAAGMGSPGAMGSGSGTPTGKPSIGNMGPQMHHHHAHSDGSGQGGGDEAGDDEYMGEAHHHHHQAPPTQVPGSSEDSRSAQVFPAYSQPYANPSAAVPAAQDHMSARRPSKNDDDRPEGLFPDMPEAKKRKFILVEDNKRGCRLRVRVTLESVDTNEIPDSFRKSSSVYPRSFFPREMQTPPPSATGSKFFQDDVSDGDVEVEGGRTGRSRGHNGRERTMVKVPMPDGTDGEVGIPRTRRSTRGKEVRLNDLGFRMAWLQSRVFSGRTVFLQRALDCYRNKTRGAIEGVMQDVKIAAPHFETRVGKRKWTERIRRGEKRDEE